MSGFHARLFALSGLAGALLAVSPSIGAPKEGPKDAEALELAKKAINTDYLGTQFAEAEKKLKEALAICGSGSSCSAKVRGKLHCDLGIVYIALSRADDGKAQFAAALKQDASATPDPDLSSPEIEAAFAEAKKSAGSRGGSAPSGGGEPTAPKGELVHTAPTEVGTNTPLPLYVELPAGTTAAKVQLSYKPYGGTEWRTTAMRPFGKGYSAEIPCGDVGTSAGTLSYFIQAFDGDSNIVSFSGSRSEPGKVAVRMSIEGEAPHLPGKEAPSRCPEATEVCPPDFPGCHDKKGGDETTCEPGAECPTTTEVEFKKNWLTLAVQQDWLFTKGTNATCAGSGYGSDYDCYYTSGNQAGTFYEPLPYPYSTDCQGKNCKVSSKSADVVSGGPVLATTRLIAGYDRAIGRFTLGVRAGFVLRGKPSGFIPVHGEGRVAFWFFKDAFSRTGLRPYLLLAGGYGEMDGRVPVKVYKTLADFNAQKLTDFDAWKSAGPAFVSAGFGTVIAVTPRMGPLLELKYTQMIGQNAPALGVQVGYTLGL